ncbi:MAG: shikimate kinase [Saccharofermentanales bacterium]
MKKKKQYGLIGHPLAHSLSPYIHKQIMKDSGISGTYRLYDLAPEEFDSKIEKLIRKLDGFNITIPYKEKIISSLESTGDRESQLGAVNTVYRKRGFNTDLPGFQDCYIPFSGKRVLLLGAGGVARVMLYEAARSGAQKITVCARRIEQAQKLATEGKVKFGCANIDCCEKKDLDPYYDTILNATPTGMWPECDGMPLPKEMLLGAEYVFDSIYNPLSTRLVLAARSYGIKTQSGLRMLYNQALEAQRIWNPDSGVTDISEVSVLAHQERLKRRLLKQSPIKIVLTGFMGSGKTTVGKSLARLLHVGFIDLDSTIVEEKKKPITAIFKSEGEEAFREAESRCLEKILQIPATLVIATGGGALIDPENVKMVRKHQGFIFYLDVPLETVLKRIGNNEDRPMLKGDMRENAEILYEKRNPIYNSISDCSIDGQQNITDVAKSIKNILGF